MCGTFFLFVSLYFFLELLPAFFLSFLCFFEKSGARVLDSPEREGFDDFFYPPHILFSPFFFIFFDYFLPQSPLLDSLGCFAAKRRKKKKGEKTNEAEQQKKKSFPLAPNL